MNNSKKPAKNMDETYSALQSLIAKGRKEGMIRTNELNAQLEKMDLTPEKIEEIYDRFESMNIQIVATPPPRATRAILPVRSRPAKSSATPKPGTTTYSRVWPSNLATKSISVSTLASV